MEFISDKCEVLSIARNRNPVIFPYTLHNEELNVTNSAKYLVVTLSKDLNWTPHINNITGKAKNTLICIKRNTKTSNTMAYNIQREYCSTIWNPWQKTLSQKLKVFNGQQHVMCATTRPYNYTSSVTSMLKSLNWHALEYRPNHSYLMCFYKIRNVLVHVDHQHTCQPGRGQMTEISPIGQRTRTDREIAGMDFTRAAHKV